MESGGRGREVTGLGVPSVGSGSEVTLEAWRVYAVLAHS